MKHMVFSFKTPVVIALLTVVVGCANIPRVRKTRRWWRLPSDRSENSDERTETRGTSAGQSGHRPQRWEDVLPLCGRRTTAPTSAAKTISSVPPAPFDAHFSSLDLSMSGLRWHPRCRPGPRSSAIRRENHESRSSVVYRRGAGLRRGG
jgi:hypothetical protein